MNKNKKILLTVLGIIFLMGANVFAEELPSENTTNTTKNTVTTTPVVKNQKNVSKLKITLSETKFSYTGKTIKPTIKVYDGSKKLKEKTHYEVTYSGNTTNPGKVTITIKGKGDDYTGTTNRTYYIAPKKAKITSVIYNRYFTSATIQWNRDNKATGYQIYYSNSKYGKYVNVKTIYNNYTTTYTQKGLKKGKMNYFKVVAYKQVGNEKIKKEYSSPETNTSILATISLNSPTSGSGRNHNLKLACNKVNGTVLKPGDTFNWFKVVGPASASRGYKKAIIFSGGKSVLGYGGGVCQVSTTVYQVSAKTGLKIVERHLHGKPVSYTKMGKDATVYYGSLNLRIKNNKKYSIMFTAYSNRGRTTCRIYRVTN